MRGSILVSLRHSFRLRNYVAQSRALSSLGGHSPMSAPPPTTNNMNPPINPGKAGPTWGVDANTEGGGIWQNTSAKREKIGELKGEMPDGAVSAGLGLEDMGEMQERVELGVIQGLGAVVGFVDGGGELFEGEKSGIGEGEDVWGGFLSGLSDVKHDSFCDEDMNEVVFNRYVSNCKGKLQRVVVNNGVNSLSKVGMFGEAVYGDKVGGENVDSKIEDSRDKVDDSKKVEESENKSKIGLPFPPLQTPPLSSPHLTDFNVSVQQFRFHLVSEALEFLGKSFQDLTTLSDTDVDRAAVAGTDANADNNIPKTVSKRKVDELIRSFAIGSCEHRVRSMWELFDLDNDGMLEQEEMDSVANATVGIVQEALKKLVDDTIQAIPEGEISKKRKKKVMKKSFDKMMKRHYEIEVEAPHRLRCVYAWSMKSHQGGLLEQVHVNNDLTGWKRYVELQPKISYEEYLPLQKEMFEMLDGIGKSYLESWKEDLLILQGSRRQNNQLFKECAAFFVVVSGIDWLVMCL